MRSVVFRSAKERFLLPWCDVRTGLAALTIGLGLWAAAHCQDAPPRPAPLKTFALRGAGSCSAAACHNSGDSSKIRGREYALCVQDKHDQAYAVLLSDRSKKIEQLYHQLPDWKTAVPERDLLCLKCHVHPQVAELPTLEVDGVRQFRLEDGVSCEVCHGPASGWLERHHRAGWKSLSPAAKREFGMLDVRGVRERAESCVACHVGAPGMEVNHDLIAAGHPRLAFEFSSYHALMKHHWDDALDKDPARGGSPDFETNAWAIGQLVTLKQSLALTRHRAKHGVWPEFAESDCQACHHDLASRGQKQTREFPGRTPGSLVPNRWYTAQAATAASLLNGAELSVKPSSDRKKAVAEIPAWMSAIDHALGSSPTIRPDDLRLRIEKMPAATWDERAQAYDALVAAERARIDRKERPDAAIRADLIRRLSDLKKAHSY